MQTPEPDLPRHTHHRPTAEQVHRLGEAGAFAPERDAHTAASATAAPGTVALPGLDGVAVDLTDLLPR